MTRTRVIDLSSHSPLPRREPVPGLLIYIYRCEHTDLEQVELRIGNIWVAVRGEEEPRTREAAVQLARDFIDAVGYTGGVRWKIGNAGVVRDEPICQ